MQENCRREIEDLHRFFEEWLTGACEDNLGRCESALAKDFEYVPPTGERLRGRDLLDSLGERYGVHDGDSFRMRVRDVHTRPVGPGMCLATYEEWHEGVEGPRGRICSAMFRRRDDAPQGVEWVHLHETWLGEGTDQE